MPIDFILFSALFVILQIVADIFSEKFLKINGIDFLFIGPWLAASVYGIYEGFVLAAALTIIHIFLNLKIAHFILFSSPAQIISVFVGNSLKISGFWIAFPIYTTVSTLTTFASGGMGGKYFIFLLTSIIFNIVLFFALVPLLK